jgi:tRNA threonylcarbamoyladenosine modification (KEOPS) complex  Pcc1 subunit
MMNKPIEEKMDKEAKLIDKAVSREKQKNHKRKGK